MEQMSVAKRRRLFKGLSACSTTNNNTSVLELTGLSACSSNNNNTNVPEFKGLSACSFNNNTGVPEFKGLSACSSNNNDTSVPEFKGLSACRKKTCFDDLPDDVRSKILVKVPTKCLHRSKCVSKDWLSLISAPSFARSYILTHLSDSVQHPNMLFIRLVSCGFGPHIVGQHFVLPLPTPLPHPVLDPFCFVPPLNQDNYVLNDHVCPKGVTERVLRTVEIQGISGGLVLLQGHFQDRTDTAQYYFNPFYYIYYVCNPLTKHWVELPQLPHVPQLPAASSDFEPSDFIGFTSYYPRQVQVEGQDSRIWAHTYSYDNIIKHIADYDPNEIEFTVIIVCKDVTNDMFIIRVFSSTDETAGWSIFRVPFPPGYRWVTYPGRNKVLFFNGMFHWCGKRCIAVYDIFNKPMQCDLIQWPSTYPVDGSCGKYFALEECEGRLRMSNRCIYQRFLTWELVDYANKVWVKKFDVTLDSEGLIFESFMGGTTRDKAYVLQHSDTTISLLDMKSGSIQDFYKYPFILNTDHHMRLMQLEPFISSPWPTSFPLRHRKLIYKVDGV